MLKGGLFFAQYAVVYTLGKQREKVCIRGPERVYTMEASDLAKGRGGFPGWWCIFFLRCRGHRGPKSRASRSTKGAGRERGREKSSRNFVSETDRFPVLWKGQSTTLALFRRRIFWAMSVGPLFSRPLCFTAESVFPKFRESAKKVKKSPTVSKVKVPPEDL